MDLPAHWTLQTFYPELRVLLAALVAIILLALLARALLHVLARISQRFSFAHALVTRIRGPVYLLLPLMGLQTVWNSASDEILLIAGLRHLNSLAIIATIAWAGLRAVGAIEQAILLHHPVDMRDNLRARQIHTQTRVLVQSLSLLVIVLAAAGMLMSFPQARQFGTSLLASAGVAGLAVGFAAKPVLGNLIAGLQIAFTQPIRLDDVVIVENEWGRIEEITGTYVVVRIWDSRRLIVPLQWFIEHPFQNWTRHTSKLLGSVFFWVDYSTPLEPIRNELERLCNQVKHLWDGEVCVLQVTDCNERAMQIRVLASSGDSSANWDLRCYLREHLLNFINAHYPESLPRVRATLQRHTPDAQDSSPSSRGDAAERQPPV